MKAKHQQIAVYIFRAELICSFSQAEEGLRVGNNSSGFAEVLRWLELNGVQLDNVCFVLEYAGGYESDFLCFCRERSIAVFHSIRFGH